MEIALSGFRLFAARLANDAAAVSMSYFRRHPDTGTKPDRSPVTNADTSIEAQMRGTIRARYPHHGILGEEYGELQLQSEYVWVVDPVDGTASFIIGLPLWGTLIALLHEGEPVLGLLDVPALKERWTGTPASCLAQDGTTCRTRQCVSLADATVCATSPDMFAGDERAVFDALTCRAKARRFGGDCYNYAMLASGYLDAVVEAGLEPYDFLSMVPIIESAGGAITDWDGKPLRMESGGRVVAAATSALHREILSFTAGL
ncbi:histidinol-phosphatase [Paraburkholderia sediminicola]|uniref:Histidinol-phosphatase n=1 Tax=Paraburkholderia rhynchosiae TaxID=487049 RepID=A0ACC7NLP5_9BURK